MQMPCYVCRGLRSDRAPFRRRTVESDVSTAMDFLTHQMHAGPGWRRTVWGAPADGPQLAMSPPYTPVGDRRPEKRPDQAVALGPLFQMGRRKSSTIMLESNCIVATSRLSKACGREESTSKTPRVRRSGAAAPPDRTHAQAMQLPIHTRVGSASLQRTLPGAKAFSGNSRLGLQGGCRVRAVRPARATANDFVTVAQGRRQHPWRRSGPVLVPQLR